MDMTPIHHVETPSGTYELNSKGLSHLTPYHTTSSMKARLISVFYKEAQKIISAPFVIEGYHLDVEKRTWNVKLLFEDGQSHNLEILHQDIDDEISLSMNRQLQKSFTESVGLTVPSYEDGYTRSATQFFESHPIPEARLLNQWSWSKPRARFVVSKGLIHLTKGFSKIEVIFRRIFQRDKMQAWEAQNQEAIKSYVSFLRQEIGIEKLMEIQKTYGFDFVEMYHSGKPLEPKHIYFCNIGMNNIEMNDVTRLGKNVDAFLSEHQMDEKLLPILQRSNHPFTLRESRALLKKFGADGTVANLYAYLGALRDDAMPAEHLDSGRFGKLIKLLETPESQWEKLYTGRKFQKQIKGAYNKEISDRKTFRPWVDQQELLQVFNEMKDPFPGQAVRREKLDHYFFEALSKIVVKKHLMRSETDGSWRVGALIPSPYKDCNGETVYYRVDKGVDSGHGKLWYVLRPACDNYDHSFPVIRAPRDTTPDLYAQRGGPTLTRDLAKHAGYRYSSTTREEDREFFKEFTLPVWMGHLAVTMRTYEGVKATADYERLTEPLRAMHQALQVEVKKRIFEKRMKRKEGKKLLRELNAIYRDFSHSNGIDQLRYAQNYIAIVLASTPYDPDDFTRFHHLMNGRVPRPLASIGNSLGGFDAQHDLVRHTLGTNRIPIVNVQLYTHSSLRIDRHDDRQFTDFVLQNEDLLNALNVRFSIRHVTEFNDKVSLFTNGTFLGRCLQARAQEALRANRHFPVDISLGVFKPILGSVSPQITELKTHLRRIEHLEEGVDYVYLRDLKSIAAFDAYAARYQFKGRKLEDWRKTGIWLNLGHKSDLIWRTWRARKGLTHRIPKLFANHKLVVDYDRSRGSSEYRFVSPIYTPRLDKVFYVKIPRESLV